MLLALMSAPLFHIHERDAVDHLESFVHAHFPEFGRSAHHDENEIEARHSQDETRWIDVFTMNTPTAVFYAIAELSEIVRMPLLDAQETTISLGAPRSHSPPYVRRAAPRSPPTV
jgi:hypothetical protein